MNPAHVETLRDRYRSALLDDVLPFWLKHGIDQEHGGFFNSVDRDGSLLDSDKSVWLQGRFSWLLAATHNAFGTNKEWLSLARNGLAFLDAHCFDPEDGLMWFHVTADGRPIRKRRYRFSESFACIANAAVFQATGEASVRRKGPPALRHFRAALEGSIAVTFPAEVHRHAAFEGAWDRR